MAKKRIGFFDVAKAVAIIAVIVGHVAIRFASDGRGASYLVGLAFSFHLPLFFVVSGYFVHADRPFALRRELRSLVLPYAVTAAAVVVGVCASNLLLHDWGSTRELLRVWGSAAVYGATDMPRNALWPQGARIGAIWFLLALFWARLATVYISRSRVPWLWVLVCYLVGYATSRWVFLPLDVQSGLCAVVFVYLGHWLRERRVFDEGHMPVWGWILLTCVWMYAVDHFTGFGMGMCDYGTNVVEMVRNVAGGVAGSMCVIGFCASLERRGASGGAWSFMERVGQMTLPVMCVHLFEDDVVRWGWIVDHVLALPHGDVLWLLVIPARVAVDVAVAWLLLKIPAVAAVFGGSAGRVARREGSKEA